MKQRGCDVDKLMGLINATEGDGLPFVEVDDMTPREANEMVDALNRANHEVNQAHPDPQMSGLPDWANPLKGLTTAAQAIGELWNKNRNWSGLLSEDYIKPLQDFHEAHYQAHFDDLSAGRAEYFEQIDDILDSLDDASLSEPQRHYAERYKQLYRQGGVFYGPNTGNLKLVNNVVGNVLQSSTTVLLGNPLELAYKLPALYPKTTVPAIGKAMEAGLFKRLPEVEAYGGYGSSMGTENVIGDRKAFEGLIGFTDIPAKNIAHFAGELAEQGGGPKAVQSVMFVPRFADVPEIYHSGAQRASVGLLSYTINTYKLIRELSRKALQGDAYAAGSLATMWAVAGGIGGIGSESGDPINSTIASGTPEPIRQIVQGLFPDTEDYFEENTGKLSGLVRPGSIDRLGVPYEIATRQGSRAVGAAADSLEAIGDGDLMEAGISMGDAVLSLLPFGKGSMVNDAQFQKVKNMAVDMMRDDLDFEDVPEEALDQLTPYVLKE